MAVKIQRDCGNSAVNMIRTISVQPILFLSNGNGIKNFSISTYFHQKNGYKEEKILARDGYYAVENNQFYFYNNFLTKNISEYEIRFLNMIAFGSGSSYKVGFLLQYLDPNTGLMMCDAVNSNVDITITDSFNIIYTNVLTWIGVVILFLSMITSLITPCIFKFSNAPKGRCLYFRCGKSLRDIIGFSHEIYLYYSTIILVTMILITFISFGILIPSDMLGSKSLQLNSDISLISPASIGEYDFIQGAMHYFVLFINISILILLSYLFFGFSLFSNTSNYFTIRMDHIPKELTDETLKKIFENKFGEDSVKEVCRIYNESKVIKYYKNAISTSKEIEKIQKKIEKSQDEKDVFEQKKDTLFRKFDEIKQQISIKQQESKDLEQVFITFSNSKYVEESVKSLPQEISLFKVTKITSFFDDIIWSNYTKSWIEIILRTMLSWFISAILLVLLLVICTLGFYFQWVKFQFFLIKIKTVFYILQRSPCSRYKY